MKPFSAIPGPKVYPLIGSLPSYWFGPYSRLKYHEALCSMRKDFGPLVKENMGGGKEIVHVFDPDDIETVYANEGKYPEIPPLQETTQMYRAGKQMSLGIGNTNGEEWYRLRSNSHRGMLRPAELRRHFTPANQVAFNFIQRIEKIKYPRGQEVTDLRTELGLWNLETSGLLVFDKRLGCLEVGSDGEKLGRQMVEANATVFQLAGILKLSFPLYKFVPTPKWRQMVKAEDFLYSEAVRLVDEAVLQLRDDLEIKGTAGNAETEENFHFLSGLLSRPELSLKDVTVICLSVFLDGLSTTTPTALFCLYSLAVNGHVQERLYEEVITVVGTDRPITAEHVAKMPFLKAFVKETFRLWPNGTEVSRYTSKPLVLSGFEIPAGTHVDLNAFVNFDDPDAFDNPEEFVPERWLKTEEVDTETTSASKIHPYLMLPFSHGTRMCAGRRIAEQHLYVLLGNLVRQFKMEYPLGEGMGQVYQTLLFPDRSVRVKFVARR